MEKTEEEVAVYYPIFLDLRNKHVLVVGGGTVACRKVRNLLEYGAVVNIVSPDLDPELERLIDGKKCRWIPQRYSSEHLQDAVAVFSCTENEDVNDRVAKDAHASQRPVNVVDDPAKCSFIVPSILKRGDLTIAVSTAGSSPLAARRIRLELEKLFGDEIKIYLQLLRSWRPEIKMHLPVDKRQCFWEKVTDGQVLSLIKAGQLGEAKEVMQKCFRSLLD